jgi:hypothetical protein
VIASATAQTWTLGIAIAAIVVSAGTAAGTAWWASKHEHQTWLRDAKAKAYTELVASIDELQAMTALLLVEDDGEFTFTVEQYAEAMASFVRVTGQATIFANEAVVKEIQTVVGNMTAVFAVILDSADDLQSPEFRERLANSTSPTELLTEIRREFRVPD